MHIGVVFPQTEMPADPTAVRDYAQAAEALGYKHILAYDHDLGANPDRPGGWHGPYTSEHSFFELFVLFSYLAGVTEALEFVSGVFILPQRETALFAKQAATLDVLCGGRLRIGIGTGWNVVEYEALNQDFHTRGKRQEEQVTLLRQLWTKPVVTFKGRWHSIPDAGLNPLPVQRPIPIWFGGHADIVLHRIAKMGDGWLPGYRTADAAAEALDRLQGYLAENGRSRSDIGLEPRVIWRMGDIDTLLRHKEAWQAAGATHLSLNTMDAGFTTPQQHIEAIRQFADAL